MSKRQRKDRTIYKEPSSDLSDLDLSSDDEGPAAGKRPKNNPTKRQKIGESMSNAHTQEETKGDREFIPKPTNVKAYQKC